MPCTAKPRGFTSTTWPWDDKVQNNPCGLPIVSNVAGVDVSAQNLCLFHYEMQYGQKAVPAGITIDAATVLLLHMDGPDLSTSFVDSSQYAHPITPVAGAKISTTQSVFGGASLALSGALTDWLTIPDSPDWAFGAGDFTWDWRVRFSTVYASRHFLGQYEGATNQRGWGVYMGGTTTLVVRLADTGANANAYSFAWTPTAGVWYHVAVVRQGNNLMAFVDGAQIGSTQTVAYALFDSSAPLMIGAVSDPNTGMYGNLDEVRISKGIARWTSNFTPPTAPYT